MNNLLHTFIFVSFMNSKPCIVSGTIYENSDKTFKHTDSDELYANAGEQDDVKILPIPYTPKKARE